VKPVRKLVIAKAAAPKKKAADAAPKK